MPNCTRWGTAETGQCKTQIRHYAVIPRLRSYVYPYVPMLLARICRWAEFGITSPQITILVSENSATTTERRVACLSSAGPPLFQRWPFPHAVVVRVFEALSVPDDGPLAAKRAEPREQVQGDLGHPGSVLSSGSGSAIKRITAGVKAGR